MPLLLDRRRDRQTQRQRDHEERQEREAREQEDRQKQKEASSPARDNWIVHTLCCFCDTSGPTDRTLTVGDLNYLSIELINLPIEGRRFKSTETGRSFNTTVIPHLEEWSMIEKTESNKHGLSAIGFNGLLQLYSDHPELFSPAIIAIAKDPDHDDDDLLDRINLIQPDTREIQDIEALILNVCQGSVLTSAISSRPSDSESLDVETVTVPAPGFSLKARRTVLATGYPTDTEEVRGGFWVDKGSRAIKVTKSLYPHQIKKRDELLDERVLEDVGDHFLFVKEAFFHSPSLAASIVRGTNTNGLTNWISEVTGRSLRETNEDSRERVQQRTETLNNGKELYELMTNELLAYGYPAPDSSGFYVRTDSRAKVQSGRNLEARAQKIRQDLIDRKKMIPDPDDANFYVFKDDCKIEARDPAAARNIARSVVLGYRAPKKEWRRVGHSE